MSPTAPTQRKIVHVDMDCFYAAVEMRDRPDLASKPLAVGGHPESRGVIATCNYIARKFGVRSALSSREAIRRCPDLVILPPRFAAYKKESLRIREIFQKYTQIIEPISLDEAYLDLSNNKCFDGSASKTAQAIRKEIWETTKLTASAGIANNKFLAKVASDWRKPNNQFTILPEQIENFMLTLPLKKIPGVGKQTQVKLKALNFETCGDLQKLSLDELVYNFGSFGERLHDLCRGIDHSTVKPHRVRKSISVEHTYDQDKTTWGDIEKQIQSLFEDLSNRMERSNISADQIKSMSVKYKFSDFQSLSKEKSTSQISLDAFIQLGYDHFLQNTKPIRLIGLGYKLKAKTPKKSRQQLNFFT